MHSYKITIHVDYEEDPSKKDTFHNLAGFLHRKVDRLCNHTDLLSDKDDVIEVENYLVEAEKIS